MEEITEILTSQQLHLTLSQKNFIKETYEILSIFYPDIVKIIKQKFHEIKTKQKNKYLAGEEFFEFIQNLRYPISFQKIKKIKKIPELKKYINIITLELDEDKFPEELRNNLKEILNQL